MNFVRHLPFLLALTLAGCVNTDHLLLTHAPPSRITQKAPVMILDTTPTRPFIKLAMVEAKETGRGTGASWEDLRHALVERAQQLDADAIMEMTTGSETRGGMVGTQSMGLVGAMGSVKQLRAIAIRYTTP
jgi:hypothetical protein